MRATGGRYRTAKSETLFGIHECAVSFSTYPWQAIGIAFLDEIEQTFTHLATQIEGTGGIRGADQDANLHCPLVGFRYLHYANPPIPFRKNAAKALRLGAQGFERQSKIDPQIYDAQ